MFLLFLFLVGILRRFLKGIIGKLFLSLSVCTGVYFFWTSACTQGCIHTSTTLGLSLLTFLPFLGLKLGDGLFFLGKVETEKFSKETEESFSWRCFGQYIFEVQTMRGFRRIIWDLYYFSLRVLPSPCPCVCWWRSVVVPRCRAQAEAMDFGCYRCVWLVSLRPCWESPYGHGPHKTSRILIGLDLVWDDVLSTHVGRNFQSVISCVSTV